MFFFSYSPCTSCLLPSTLPSVPSWLPTTIVKCRHAMVVCFCFGRHHIKPREHIRHVNMLEHGKTCSACYCFPGLVSEFCPCVQPLGLQIMRMPSSLSVITYIIHIGIPYTLPVQITLREKFFFPGLCEFGNNTTNIKTLGCKSYFVLSVEL